MKFKDAHDDETVPSKREPTGLIVNASGIFEKMDHLTLHLLVMDEEITTIYFKTKFFCVLFTVVNIMIMILINIIMQ